MLSVPHPGVRCHGRSGVWLSTAAVGADLVTRSHCNRNGTSHSDTFAQALLPSSVRFALPTR